MNLTERLRAVGTRLGLMQSSATPSTSNGSPVKITTRTVTLAELRTEIRGDRIAALAPAIDDDAGLSVSFTTIDEAAGVHTPPHGWTAERVAELVRRPEFSQADRSIVQQAVLIELAKAGAPTEDVVRDALARDRAVDAYAAATHAALVSRHIQRQQRSAELIALIEHHRKDLAALEHQDALDRERWTAWWATKLTRELALTAAVDAVLDQPMVTVDRDLPPIL